MPLLGEKRAVRASQRFWPLQRRQLDAPTGLNERPRRMRQIKHADCSDNVGAAYRFVGHDLSKIDHRTFRYPIAHDSPTYQYNCQKVCRSFSHAAGSISVARRAAVSRWLETQLKLLLRKGVLLLCACRVVNYQLPTATAARSAARASRPKLAWKLARYDHCPAHRRPS
jgi:hypothetical protein